MFLRKITVILVPLLMLVVLCMVSPLLDLMDYSTSAILRGAAVGLCLALLLPLSGAIRRREPFGWLLWVPAVLTIAVLICQVLSLQGVASPILSVLSVTDGQILQIESIFAAYMLTTCIRTQL